VLSFDLLAPSATFGWAFYQGQFQRFALVEPVVISEKYLGMGGAISPPACRSGAEVDFLFN